MVAAIIAETKTVMAVATSRKNVTDYFCQKNLYRAGKKMPAFSVRHIS
jgi:hypothetical protein